ncbi:MAG: hypothetical protein RH917_04235 [Lacipirellulaceae bacterium]
MLNFRTSLYARPESLIAGEFTSLRGFQLKTLCGPGPQTIFDAYLPVTFEEALKKLQELPRMDAEPDGFFVYSGDSEGKRWQIDGHLYDFNNQLHRVELSGSCPKSVFNQLLAIFAADETPAAFELIREGVVLDKENFDRWAGATEA